MQKTYSIDNRCLFISEQEDVAARSMTIWYTDVTDDTPTKEKPEEVVSYSTSIVGGVVHRVPIISKQVSA